jgi:hypothetical protein
MVFLKLSVVLLLCFLENTVIIAATAVTLPDFLQIFAISLALALLRIPGAFLVTLIGRAVVDEKLMPFGLSNLRRSSLPKLVSLDPVSYSLLESLVESYERFLCFLPLAAFFWPF